MQASILIAIPLVSKNRVLGAMVLGYPDGGGVRLEHDRYLLLTLGHQIGAAIEAAQLFEETKKLDQLKSEFVSKVSHELRTPLTSIKGFGEILGSYDDIDPVSRQEFIQIINEESDRLTRLINDLLDLSKIEAGKVEWMIQPIDLGQVLRYTVKQMQAVAMKKPVGLALDLPPSIPLALGDRDQLVQVMENLLSNAIKFTPEGTITVGVSWNREEPTGRQTRPGREPAQSDPPQTHHLLTVFVQDNGIGIPPHELAAIFEKFHQITDSDKNRPKGTGLGLALCREILHRLGGEIWCESTLGLGSRFLFTLPVVTPLIMRSTADPSLTRTAPATPGDTHQARTPHIP
jgi:sigma-B regulation protein RsbU (phosphoserine phosphatase)